MSKTTRETRPIAYPVRLERDGERVDVHIRDSTNRVVASGLIGRDAAEIVRVLNEAADKTEEEARLRRQGITSNCSKRVVPSHP